MCTVNVKWLVTMTLSRNERFNCIRVATKGCHLWKKAPLLKEISH